MVTRLLLIVLRFPERLVIAFSVERIRPERVTTVPESAFCARISVK